MCDADPSSSWPRHRVYPVAGPDLLVCIVRTQICGPLEVRCPTPAAGIRPLLLPASPV